MTHFNSGRNGANGQIADRSMGDAVLRMRDCPDSILTKHRYVWSPTLASITSGIGVTQAGMQTQGV